MAEKMDARLYRHGLTVGMLSSSLAGNRSCARVAVDIVDEFGYEELLPAAGVGLMLEVGDDSARQPDEVLVLYAIKGKGPFRADGGDDE